MKEIALFLAFIVIVVFIMLDYVERQETNSYIVASQAGFEIDVNNEIMIEACKFHSISNTEIRWDIVNKDFVFYRDNKRCYVFTQDFRNYLDKIGYVDSLEINKEVL